MPHINKELIIENLVGILAAIAVIVAIIFSALWVNQQKQAQPQAVTATIVKEPKLQASSVDDSEINAYKQKIAERKAAEAKKIADERNKIAAEKAQLAAEIKKKQRQAAQEKKRLAQERQRLEKEKQQAEIAAKKEKQRIANERKAFEAEKKRQAEAARKKAEAEKKRQAEAARKKAEAEKKRQAEAARKKAEAEKKRQAEAARKRIAAELAADISAREAQEAKAAEAAAKQQAIYHSQMAIKHKVNSQWTSPANLPHGLSVKLAIKLSSSGKVIASPRVLQSSGYQAFDNSAIEAVKRASPLPLPNEKAWANEFTKEDLILNFP